MKIIVIGNGKVGSTIIEHTCSEGHEVTVIDNDPNVIEAMVNKYDVMGICGNGVSYEIQREAGASHADLVVAATNSDEVNILACTISKSLGAKATIARVRNYEYNAQVNEMKENFGITTTINPELESAKEIMNIINFPEAIHVDTFSDGNVELVELYIPQNSPLIGKTLQAIRNEYQVKILVCAVQRGEQVFIPSGNFSFNAKDKVHITASKKVIKTFLSKLGLIEEKLKDIIIIGGSRISIYLAEELLKNKYNVKIIERDHDTCVKLSELLSDAAIIEGDGSDQNVLEEEGLDNADAVICLTGMDEENIIISMYAQKKEVSKIITKVDKSNFSSIMETLGVASVISPKEIVASKIVSYVRANSNLEGSNIVQMYKLVNNKVEALEFIAKESSKAINIPLKELTLQANVLIASIIRGSEVIIPSGFDEIKKDDKVIIITMSSLLLDDLDDILR